MDVESQPLPAQQYVQFAEMHPGPSSGAAAASASAALACNLSTILTFSCRSTADQLARSLQLKLKNIGNNREAMVTDTNNNASPTRSPTNSLPRVNGLSALINPPQSFSPPVSNTYLLAKGDSKDGINGDAGDGESDDSDDDFKERVKRSSSLKSGKTPPGTPGRKKIVRFADALGLDLAEVRSFLDEIPSVPKSAYKDLDCAAESLKAQKPFNSFTLRSSSSVLTSATATGACPPKTLVSTFHQPVSRPDFFDKVREQKVLLENAYLSDNFTIKGTVRVLNMDFHKSVYIRHSLDEWNTFTEIQAAYVSGSCDGFSDKFDFAIQLNSDKLEIGSKVSFAARFHCQGQQFWDSNCGLNYEFHVTPTSSSSSVSAPIGIASSHHRPAQNHFNYTNSPVSYSPMGDQWSMHMWM